MLFYAIGTDGSCSGPLPRAEAEAVLATLPGGGRLEQHGLPMPSSRRAELLAQEVPADAYRAPLTGTDPDDLFGGVGLD